MFVGISSVLRSVENSSGRYSTFEETILTTLFFVYSLLPFDDLFHMVSFLPSSKFLADN
jgi:hypothetical protein